MDIILRRASAADLPVLEQFEQALIRDERPFDPTIRQDPVRYYDLPGLLSDGHACLLVAELGDRVVASGYAARRSPRPYLDHDAYAYFGFMYTLPQFRGRGINGRIVEALKAWARQQGLTEMRLTVYQDNLPAVKAYEKTGFQPHILEMRFRD